MQFRIQVVVVGCDGGDAVHEVATIERAVLQPETLGLNLAESKAILSGLQEVVVEQQAMQWTPEGAHLLLHARTRVLNDDLEVLFREWYPGFRRPADTSEVDAAA